MSRLLLPLALALFALSACGGVDPAQDDAGFVDDGGLDLNDVSFLYPLPASSSGVDGLLPVSTQGNGGPLLPRAVFDQLPPLVTDADAGTVYGQLRVVSARVDPCFPATASGGCLKQIRLVAQPVVFGADAGFQVTTEDTTVHLFYTLDDATFSQVRKGVLDLKALAGTATDGKPLDVHPVMKAQGLDGAYAQKLDQVLLSACGEKTLMRVATMSVAQGGGSWNFQIFDLSTPTAQVETIPRIDREVQGFREFGNEAFRSGEIVPQLQEDDLSTLLNEVDLRTTDEGTLDRALTETLTYENPHLSSPRTVDCVSCHVASRSRANAEAKREVDTSSWPTRYTAPARFDLSRVDGAGDDPHALRNFGYFGRLSALSQRTINESAEVAMALSRPQ